MKYANLAISVVLLLAFAHAGLSQNRLSGQVIDVLDGRTIVIDLTRSKLTAVLQFIEVPEPGQPLNKEVTDHLRHLLLGRIVEFKARFIVDNKAVGGVFLKDLDVSQQMLRDGAAWLAPPELTGDEMPERESYSMYEAQAKAEKLGVWSIRDLKPAWDFRAAKEESKRQEEQRYWEQYSRVTKPGTASRGRGNANPGIGNAGALINNFDTVRKSGSLRTPILGVIDPDSSRKTAAAVGYFYQEDGKSRRTGFFSILMLSAADHARFRSSDLTVTVDDQRVAVSKARRSEKKIENSLNETLEYTVSRSTVEKMANGSQVILRVNDYSIILLPGYQMLLYNLLDASK